MEHLPFYIPGTFVLTTLLTILLIYKASNYSRTLILTPIFWLVVQAVLSVNDFYLITTGVPPRFALSLMPPVLLILILFVTKKGRVFLGSFNAKTLTLLHTVRIPVELTLYWLFLHKGLPEIMTFEGRNFDILCGLTAPLVYYFGFIKNALSKEVLLAWNIICLILVINIVATAILSAPFAFQKFGFEQPNIALLYFPYVWLPSFVVPCVLLAHLINIRQLINENKYVK